MTRRVLAVLDMRRRMGEGSAAGVPCGDDCRTGGGRKLGGFYGAVVQTNGIALWTRDHMLYTVDGNALWTMSRFSRLFHYYRKAYSLFPIRALCRSCKLVGFAAMGHPRHQGLPGKTPRSADTGCWDLALASKIVDRAR